MSSEWQTTEHALRYLQRADRVPHRTEGEATLLDEVPKAARRILDLGAGDGRLLGLLFVARSGARGVAVEFSPPVLEPGGIFCNLEHVASPSSRVHLRFLEEYGITPEQEDKSNKLLDMETQLQWLTEIGFEEVDCYLKWRELSLLVGRKPCICSPA